MKHTHCDLICAKAANMDLVLFIKEVNGEWEGGLDFGIEQLVKWEDMEFFACLPQHADACLHWLNGGELEMPNMNLDHPRKLVSEPSWYPEHSFMSDKYQFRIKPRKEKRYLMVQSMSGECTKHFSTPKHALDCVSDNDKRWQLVEIEVEV